MCSVTHDDETNSQFAAQLAGRARNRLKPLETRRIGRAAKVLMPNEVAASVGRGIERGKARILRGFQARGAFV